LAADGGIDCLA